MKVPVGGIDAKQFLKVVETAGRGLMLRTKIRVEMKTNSA